MAEQVTTFLGPSTIISALGVGVEENFSKIADYQSGLKLETLTDIRPEPIPIQRIPDQILSDASRFDGFTRLEKLIAISISDILAKSQIDTHRTALLISTTKGNVALLGNETPEADSTIYLSNMARKIARTFGLCAAPVISTACISGVAAVVVATRMLRQRLFENVIVIGADEVSTFVTTGFVAFKSVSTKICRPYDASHDGLSLGEAVVGALITTDAHLSSGIVIEGGALSDDANHISGPSRTGEPLASAILTAMSCNNLTASDIDYVNAHGTATVYNDEMESKAINLAGLASVPINSLKPYYGHTLGASGVLEIVLCAEQMRRSLLIGTLGYEKQGTPFALNVSAQHRRLEIRRCVKTASGFGGTNAAVVLAKQEFAKPLTNSDLSQLKIEHSCTLRSGKATLDGKTICESDGDFPTFIRQVYHEFAEPNMKFFKMDDMSKLGYMTAEILLKNIDLGDPKSTAIVLMNRSSSLASDLQHNRVLASGAPASPAVFVYTLPNVVMGEICIRHKIQGETIFFVADKFEDELCSRYVQMLLARYKQVIYGWCEYNENNYESEFYICKP